jgi:hypothetical protein
MVDSAKPQRRIISIAAAPGWGALIEQPDDPYGEPRLVTLAAWALAEDADGETQLVGLVQRPMGEGEPPGSFWLADEVDGFTGYSNQGLKTRPAD